jgi:hypothetical protein
VLIGTAVRACDTDYERLMRLEEMNARKKDGASQEQIGRLPIIPVRHVSGVYICLVLTRDEQLTGVVLSP